MNKLRFAYLGINGRGQGLLDLYRTQPDVTFTAFCDIVPGRAEAVANNHNAITGDSAKAYTSYEEMARDAKYDALLIACDPDIQVDYACDAMERGVHVMTEVPAAFTIPQCHKLVDTVRKTGCKYQLGEQTRYWHFFKLWREMAARGDFGKIIFADGEYLHYEPAWDYFRNKTTHESVWTSDPSLHNNPDLERSWRYRAFMNPIYYLPHELSPLLSVTGGRITRVSCMGTRQGGYTLEGFDVRDIQTALMYNSDDVVFTLRAGFSSPYGPKAITGAHWYHIKGSKQTVEWARSTIDTPKLYDAASGTWTQQNWDCVDHEASEEIQNSSHGGADLYPFLYFIDAIRNDKQPPMDVYKAVESAAPAILAAESCEKGGILLEVPDFRA